MKIINYIMFWILATAASPLLAEDTTMPTDQEAIDQEAVREQEAVTETETTTNMEGFSRGSVVRSIFTTDVEDREPTNNLKEMSNTNDNIIYYTELRDMDGQTAKHRWEYNGEVMAEVEFEVRGPRWRVWSSKSLMPEWIGEWKVSVLNGANEVISEDVFQYTRETATQ